MKEALTVPSGDCGKAAFLLCRGSMEGWAAERPEWGPVEGVGTQGRREVTKGIVGLLHSSDLKKRTCRIPEKLLHTERFSASRCVFVPFSQPSDWTDSWASARPVAGRVTGRESQNQAAAHGGKRNGWTNRRICNESYQTFRLSRAALSYTVATSSNARVSISGAARKTPSMFLWYRSVTLEFFRVVNAAFLLSYNTQTLAGLKVCVVCTDLHECVHSAPHLHLKWGCQKNITL